MDRTKRTAAVVVGIAVLLAAIATLGMYRIVSQIPATAAEMETVDVVVAQHPLKLGTRISRDHVKVVQWPAKRAGGWHVRKGRRRRRPWRDFSRGRERAADEHETRGARGGAGLPPSIPPGMRAISVKVNEVVGVAGFVVPGTRVDVMVTLSKGMRDDDSLTRVVVSNAQVLTAGTRYDQEKAKEGTPIPSTVVTLLVTPEDGERIALAASEGQIMLALRNPLDTTPTTTTGVRTAGLFGQPPVKDKPVASVGAGQADSARRCRRSAETFDLYGRSDPWGQAHRGDRPMSVSSQLWGHRPRGAALLVALVVLGGDVRAQQPPAPAVPGQVPATPAQAPAMPAPGARPQFERVPVTAGRSTIVPTDFAITRIAITNPEVADAVVVQPREILIDGKKAGTVSLIVWGSDRRAQYDIVVEPAITTLEQQLQALFPGEAITVSVSDEAMILSGQVSSTAVMLRAGEIARSSSSKVQVINMLQVPGGNESQQVMLQVRFAEVNRRALTELGLSLFVTRDRSRRPIHDAAVCRP